MKNNCLDKIFVVVGFLSRKGSSSFVCSVVSSSDISLGLIKMEWRLEIVMEYSIVLGVDVYELIVVFLFVENVF